MQIGEVAASILLGLKGMSSPIRSAERIRADLEKRGVAAEFSQALSRRLESVLVGLPPEAYEALLAGVALAWREGRPAECAALPSRVELDEMQRLMGDFAGELRKLDEALELLTAYLTRMRAQAPAGDRTLH